MCFMFIVINIIVIIILSIIYVSHILFKSLRHVPSEIIVLQATVWGVFSTGIDDVSYLLLGTILLLRYL